MFLTGPAVVREVIGEDITSRRARRPRRARAQRRLRTSWRARDADAVVLARDLLGYLPQPAAPGASAGVAGIEPAGDDPGAVVPARAAPGLRRARRDRARWSTTGARSRCWPQWARNMVIRARPDRRPPRRGGRQPAALPRRRARRRRRPEGGALRAHLQRASACRWWCWSTPRASCPASQPGGGGRDPPRREAAARLRRGHGAEADGGAAQGLRRRLHHDELARTSAPTSSSPGRGAEIGVMGARQAVGVVHRRDLAEAADARRPARRAGRRLRRGAPPGRTRPLATGSSTR